ncbi:MAG: copper amine oxidase N-terminal domain-containing protein, partial [Mycobacterium leprae]
MRVGVLRVVALLGLLALLASAFPGVGRAEGGFAEGYCTADGKPVVTYLPADWIDGQWIVECYDGEAVFTHTTPYNPNLVDTAPLEQPPDFGRWVDIAFNGAWLVNPYKDVDPFVVKSTGRTLIPLRYVSEAFGAQVDWVASTRTATIKWHERAIAVQIGETQAFIDGRAIVL